MNREPGFRVAFVCTGNRFRSPLAAGVFADEAARIGVGVDVDSFGVLDVAAAPALPEALELGTSFGVDLAAHRARALSRDTFAPHDLVVGFERFHLATAVVDGGARRDATYTLPELVALLGDAEPVAVDDPIAYARVELARVAKVRDAGPAFRGVPEIADPLGLPRRAQRTIAETVVQQTRELARCLFGAGV